MTLQINHNVTVCDEAYRKLVTNTFPGDEICDFKEVEIGEMTIRTVDFKSEMGIGYGQSQVKREINHL